MFDVKFIEYKGKRILYHDMRECDSSEFADMLNKSMDLAAKEPLSSILSIAIGGENTPIFTDHEMFINYLAKNTPYVKASAVACLPEIKMKMLASVMNKSERKLQLFKTEEEALEWLISFK
ncbi:MAG TPA: hypothetical protein PLB12_09515 [Candidatus Goldiibacteriota bacterium]|nr:hypothetical protein [Candidatus Goldiibacteriota bacterium]HPI04687.1 hypothetical protein [Candidatus Goldiibacteriota bacterium]HPN64698.1 hypothetical protein [Candidatus Goldiibacteriota bacterium]HRQ44577.1 hypothetical protein [Candidatus Goldiibacteriota bacterium]